MGYLNIEIKANCDDQESVREYLKSRGAILKGVDHQIDTYFTVPKGRLKLRQGNIANGLVYYERSDKKGPKQSEVTVYRFKEGDSLKEVLIKALEILVIVDKKREIYSIENVIFHIDSVKGLGNFIEIESSAEDGSLDKNDLYKLCEYYLEELSIRKKDLVMASYSDLLIQKKETSNSNDI